ncbi:MAG: AAA family ATPase [Candidatus Lokiarchaeota archaeon]|nr:AAA family ATPase [Candidatus Lokiarchaeota archaeon]
MIIAISGLHGTGKTTVSKKIAKKFNLTWYSTGKLFRELAKEKGLTLDEMSKLAEKNRDIDEELDQRIRDYAMKGNCVLDNQLSPYLLGDIIDYCILLKCSRDVRIERIAERDETTIDYAINETLVREESEHQRFIEYYGIDLLDAPRILGTFDLIIDTTYLDDQSVTNVIETALKEFKKNNPKKNSDQKHNEWQ